MRLVCTGNGYKEANMHKWGPGYRNVYTLHYILSGEGFIETKEGIFSLKAKDSFLIFPDEEYYYYPNEENPWEYVWVDFYGSEADRLVLMTGFTKSKPVMSVVLPNGFFKEEENSDKRIKAEREAAKVHLLLTSYFKKEVETRKSTVEEYVEEARQYIQNHFWETDLSVSTIANAIGLERSYLYRSFKQVENMSPQEFLTEFRMEQACEILQRKDSSIQAVACSVGYEDALYFSKVFRKTKGISPSAYQKSLNLSFTER